jgi:hypothetical protein
LTPNDYVDFGVQAQRLVSLFETIAREKIIRIKKDNRVGIDGIEAHVPAALRTCGVSD